MRGEPPTLIDWLTSTNESLVLKSLAGSKFLFKNLSLKVTVPSLLNSRGRGNFWSSEIGFKPADDAYKRWEGYAFNDFGPGNKSGPLADRIDTEDVQSFYDTYYASRLVDDETFVGSSNLRYMFEEPAAVASTEANPNEANVSPSQGVDV